jgi:hypothetical protein
MTKAMLTYIVAFWVVVDYGVPFVLGLAGAPIWTPLAWAFAKGIYVGWAQWPPPEQAIDVAFSHATGHSAINTAIRYGMPGFCFGVGLRTVFSSNTLWFFAIFAAGYYLRTLI